MGKDNGFYLLGGLGAVAAYALLIVTTMLYLMHKEPRPLVPDLQQLEVTILDEKPTPKVLKVQPPRPKPKPKPTLVPVKKEVQRSVKHEQRAVEKPSIASLFKGVKVGDINPGGAAAKLKNAPKIKYTKTRASEETKKMTDTRKLVDSIDLAHSAVKITTQSSAIGESDPYITQLHRRIFGSWQPESLFIGCKATVRLIISPDGSLIYLLREPSDNQAFNQSLIEYLDRLRFEGLPPHKHARSLQVDVNFEVKE